MIDQTWIMKTKKIGTTLSTLSIVYRPNFHVDNAVYEYGNMCVKNIQKSRLTEWIKLETFLDNEE